ncbi:hypothetical protein GCM10023238_33930 [Streptomyces heliomycini]
MEQRTPGAGAGSRVLVVDDDPTVAEIVTGYLDRAGTSSTGPATAPTRWPARRPTGRTSSSSTSCCRGMDGLEVCRRMRGRGPVPVIMLTARGRRDDRILGLEVGADDYVTKPFSPARTRPARRVRARRARPAPAAASGLLRAGGLINRRPRCPPGTKNGAELALTIREFDLLAFFLRHPGRALRAGGADAGGVGLGLRRPVHRDVHVRRLRGKVRTIRRGPGSSRTVWGVGYRFDPAAVSGGVSGSGTRCSSPCFAFLGAATGRGARRVRAAADPRRSLTAHLAVVAGSRWRRCSRAPSPSPGHVPVGARPERGDDGRRHGRRGLHGHRAAAGPLGGRPQP